MTSVASPSITVAAALGSFFTRGISLVRWKERQRSCEMGAGGKGWECGTTLGEVRRVLHFARPLQKKKKKRMEGMGNVWACEVQGKKEKCYGKVERVVRDLGERKEEGRVGF